MHATTKPLSASSPAPPAKWASRLLTDDLERRSAAKSWRTNLTLRNSRRPVSTAPQADRGAQAASLLVPVRLGLSAVSRNGLYFCSNYACTAPFIGAQSPATKFRARGNSRRLAC